MRAVPVQPGHRLNVLLTELDAPDTPGTPGTRVWSDQLPRLLEPQGVHAIRAADVDEAVRAIEAQPIHAAVVDLRLPLHREEASEESGAGLKLLRVIQRLDPAPPAVIVRGRRFDDRADNRVLAEALKLDAFSVLDQPVQLEQLLDTLRRLIQRYYGGHWPKGG